MDEMSAFRTSGAVARQRPWVHRKRASICTDPSLVFPHYPRPSWIAHSEPQRSSEDLIIRPPKIVCGSSERRFLGVPLPLARRAPKRAPTGILVFLLVRSLAAAHARVSATQRVPLCQEFPEHRTPNLREDCWRRLHVRLRTERHPVWAYSSYGKRLPLPVARQTLVPRIPRIETAPSSGR
jgi:hypothetical protein